MLSQENPIMAKANKVMDIFYMDEQERKRYEAMRQRGNMKATGYR